MGSNFPYTFSVLLPSHVTPYQKIPLIALLLLVLLLLKELDAERVLPQQPLLLLLPTPQGEDELELVPRRQKLET